MDLDAYLVSNCRMKAFNSRWRCPTCDLEVRPRDLRIDEYVERILSATSSVVEEVFVAVDGTWRVEQSDSVDVAAIADQPGEVPAGVSASHVLDEGQGLSVPTLKRRFVSAKSAPNVHFQRMGHHKSRRHRKEEKGVGKPLVRGRRQARGKPSTHFVAKHDSRGMTSKCQRPGNRSARAVAALRRAARISALQRHEIAVDSDAAPEMVSDSGPDADLDDIKRTGGHVGDGVAADGGSRIMADASATASTV